MIRTHDAGSLRADNVGQTVTLAGWVARRRDHGGVAFIDLREASGVVQVVIRDEAVAHHLRAEYCLKVTGEVSLRPAGNQNPNLATGDVEVVFTHAALSEFTGQEPPAGDAPAKAKPAAKDAPAKDASVPNLVPPDKLEQANQYSLLGTFGPAPIAGLFFGLLALVSRSLGSISPYFSTDQVSQINLALYFNAATFIVSAITIYLLHEIP